MRRLGKEEVGVGIGWVAGRAQSVRQSGSLQRRLYQVRPKVRSLGGCSQQLIHTTFPGAHNPCGFPAYTRLFYLS